MTVSEHEACCVRTVKVGKGPFGCSGQRRPLGRGPTNVCNTYCDLPLCQGQGSQKGAGQVLQDLFQSPDLRAIYWIGSVAGGKRREVVLCVAWTSPEGSPREVRLLKVAWPGWSVGISQEGGMSKGGLGECLARAGPSDLDGPLPHCRLLSEWAAHWHQGQGPWAA